MLFVNVDAALRTDQNFIDGIDEDHHVGQSPFEEAGIDMVSQFPIDYMRNCCLGVILTTFVKVSHAHKWSAKQIAEISGQLVKIAKWIPQEFARKPRKLQYVDRFKATEFRQFLLNNVLLRVKNISVSDGKISLTGESLLDPVSFPNYPVSSLDFQIYVGNTWWSQTMLFSAEEVKMKAVCIPYKETFCFLPLIHSDIES
ncbi:uncharacterized protein LOC113381063 [Ctenocephalides felis]|uniref:uncharacterized protein LOC113381063 n=1 Tax=Ctenocephalides felis TaxID=7515 RepID=UPI000E6E1169|nr:uncharacterized protein LOC113381063 [Ctenocephalides felis]